MANSKQKIKLVQESVCHRTPPNLCSRQTLLVNFYNDRTIRNVCLKLSVKACTDNIRSRDIVQFIAIISCENDPWRIFLLRAKAFQSDHGFPLQWINLHCPLSRSFTIIMEAHGSGDIYIDTSRGGSARGK